MTERPDQAQRREIDLHRRVCVITPDRIDIRPARSAAVAPLIGFFEDMVEAGTISEADLRLFMITDSVDEAMAHIEKHSIQKFGLTRAKTPKRRWWLGETRHPSEPR